MLSSIYSLKRELAELQQEVDQLPRAGAAAEDPIAWLKTVSPGIELDDWQADFMRNESKRALLLCSRQVGKSFAVAARAAYHAVSQPGSTTLVLAPSYRQSQLLYSKIQRFINDDPAVTVSRNTKVELELSNGSSVVSLPGDDPNKTRGYTASFVAIDEGAYVRDSVIAALFPMLATVNGSITMLTTPSAASGVFHAAWTNTEEQWDRTKVLATECSRIPPEFIEEAQLRLGDLAFRREYQCEFVSSENAFFNSDQIAAAFAPQKSSTDLIKEQFSI